LSLDKFQHRIERLSRKIAKSNCKPKTKTTKTAVHSDREESFDLQENERREACLVVKD